MTCCLDASETYLRVRASLPNPTTVLSRPIASASSSGGSAETTRRHIASSSALKATWTSEMSKPSLKRSIAIWSTCWLNEPSWRVRMASDHEVEEIGQALPGQGLPGELVVRDLRALHRRVGLVEHAVLGLQEQGIHVHLPTPPSLAPSWHSTDGSRAGGGVAHCVARRGAHGEPDVSLARPRGVRHSGGAAGGDVVADR